jgi:cytochrome c-type biogenesis protein CcmH/NrfG
MGPGARAIGAAVILAAYYWLLIAHPFAQKADAIDLQLQADIRDSRALFDAKKFVEALPPTERLTTQLASQALYHDRHAQILHELHRPADEAKAWEQVMATSPTPVDACPMIAQAYQQAGDQQRALDAFERCAELPPLNPDFLVYLGQALLKADRTAEARRAFERGLAIDPTYPDLHLLLGIRRFADGDRDGARAGFETFLKLAPARRDEVAIWLERVGQKP